MPDVISLPECSRCGEELLDLSTWPSRRCGACGPAVKPPSDDERELAMYLANGRHAFWLFPDRWEGVDPHAAPMAFDDGTWQPPAPPPAPDTPCSVCFKFGCDGTCYEARMALELDACTAAEESGYNLSLAYKDARRLGFDDPTYVAPRLLCRFGGKHLRVHAHRTNSSDGSYHVRADCCRITGIFYPVTARRAELERDAKQARLAAPRLPASKEPLKVRPPRKKKPPRCERHDLPGCPSLLCNEPPTTACPGCGGQGIETNYSGRRTRKCRHCRGSGRVYA